MAVGKLLYSVSFKHEFDSIEYGRNTKHGMLKMFGEGVKPCFITLFIVQTCNTSHQFSFLCCNI